MSPDSLSSKTCAREYEYAALGNKRIVPVVVRDVDAEATPAIIRHLNWLFFHDSEDFDATYKLLINTIETDLAWVRAHTRLLVRAKEWKDNESDPSFLLAGSDLEESELVNTGGEGGIRTPGPVRINGFQDRRIRPLCHLS